MTRALPSDRDVIIAHAPADGSLRIFEDFEERADGSLIVSGVLESERMTFYGLDGEKFDPVVGQYDWIERLVPTGSQDLSGLIQLTTKHARSHEFDADGSDPRAFVNEMWRRDYEARSPKWPRWLDRWIHGGPPKGI